jgi:hypothetical protein
MPRNTKLNKLGRLDFKGIRAVGVVVSNDVPEYMKISLSRVERLHPIYWLDSPELGAVLISPTGEEDTWQILGNTRVLPRDYSGALID